LLINNIPSFLGVIPAWSAGIQVNMDVSGGILAALDAGHPSMPV
jgi:hypothetical protein